MARMMAAAAKPLQYALRLALITGQRPADVIRLSEADTQGGVLNVKQGKTGAKLRIAIEGELAALLSEIRDFKQLLKCMHWRCLSMSAVNP